VIVEILGLDGAGKTTVTRRLAASLGGRARKVTAYDPDFEQAAAMVRSRLGYQAEWALRGCAVASALLREAAHAGDGLDIFDRYVEAARMFFSVQEVHPVADSVLTDLPQPDLVVLLDVDVSTAMARRKQSTFGENAEEAAYLRKCASYLRSAAAARGWQVIDASEGLDGVLARARAAVQDAAGRRSELTVTEGPGT
jgi:dTMP kinase